MTKKIGRNDPCPCGSGKKYKQCCMLKEQETSAAKYTASGKRKFKAKLLSAQDKSISVFSRSATGPQAPSEGEGALQRLKVRMTEKDYRTEDSGEQETFIHEESTPPKPTEKKITKIEETFKPTTEDFRVKEDEE